MAHRRRVHPSDGLCSCGRLRSDAWFRGTGAWERLHGGALPTSKDWRERAERLLGGGDAGRNGGESMGREGEVDVKEPQPTTGREVVLPRVMRDLQKRSDFGEQKYSTKLMTFNGRDALMDAYQEALDLVVYLAQAVMEREGRMSQQELQEENTRLVLENRRLQQKLKDMEHEGRKWEE